MQVRRMPRHGALRMAEQQEVGAVEVVEEKAAVSGYSAVPGEDATHPFLLSVALA